MKTIMVIPTYWSRERKESWREGDAIYDHPTPIDEEGTLGRTLDSINILNNKDFKLVIPICPTCFDVEDEAEKKVKEIIRKHDPGVETYVFTAKNLREIKEVLEKDNLPQDAGEILCIRGYSNVRNICLYVASALGGEVVIMIDDDEIFEKPDYVDLAREFMGKRMYGKGIFGMAGYYLNKYDEFYDDVDIVPWMTYWDRFGSKTKAFDKIIGCDPRIKVTPFAFGGAMVIHKNMFNMIPFDPKVTRGEDIDYLINAKMFGFDFFLDNKLNVKHLPPKKNHPIWKRFREDIYRFLYEQSKIRSQYEVNSMNRIFPEDFDPYPGEFLKDDLEDKIFKTNVLLALEYLSEGDIEGCRESIRNVYLSKYEAVPKIDTFTEYRKLQKKWTKLIQKTADNRNKIKSIMEGNNLNRVIYKIDEKKYYNISRNIIEDNIKHLEYFKNLTEEEIAELSEITKMKAYNKDEIIFEEGGRELSLSFILHGRAKIVTQDDKKEEIILSILEKGDVVGETFLTKDVYNVTCIADDFVEMISMKKEQLDSLIDENPTLGNKLLRLFLDKMYWKLNKTNILYKETVENNEDISEM